MDERTSENWLAKQNAEVLAQCHPELASSIREILDRGEDPVRVRAYIREVLRRRGGDPLLMILVEDFIEDYVAQIS